MKALLYAGYIEVLGIYKCFEEFNAKSLLPFTLNFQSEGSKLDLGKAIMQWVIIYKKVLMIILLVADL